MGDIDILREFLQIDIRESWNVFKRFQKEWPEVEPTGKGLKSFLYIPGWRTNNKVLLVAHADTYWDKEWPNYKIAREKTPLFFNEDDDKFIAKCDDVGIGADDRAGCAMSYLLGKELGHSILITNGEEHGQEGSHFLVKEHSDIIEKMHNQHQFFIQLDRRRISDWKMYGEGRSEGKRCGDKENLFARYINDVTEYEEPDKTQITDIVILCYPDEINIRRKCGVNLSIGYHNEHNTYHSDDNNEFQPREYIVKKEWLNTLNICRKWLRDDNLPPFFL